MSKRTIDLTDAVDSPRASHEDDDEMTVDVDSGSSLHVISTTPRPSRRQNELIEPRALTDEAVLTSLVIFGAFLDVGMPFEIIQLLCHWTCNIYRSVEAFSARFDSLRTDIDHKLIVCPAFSSNLRTVDLSQNEPWNYHFHISIGHTSFTDFISRVFLNVMVLIKQHKAIREMEQAWFNRVKEIMDHNFPGKTFFITMSSPWAKGSTAIIPTPRLEFALTAANGVPIKGFLFNGLKFPQNCNKAFVTVISETESWPNVATEPNETSNYDLLAMMEGEPVKYGKPLFEGEILPAVKGDSNLIERMTFNVDWSLKAALGETYAKFMFAVHNPAVQ
jgi:hypothetical protein